MPKKSKISAEEVIPEFSGSEGYVRDIKGSNKIFFYADISDESANDVTSPAVS